MNDGPIHRYRMLINAGEISKDPEQEMAAEALQLLHGRLKGYSPPMGRGLWSSFFGTKPHGQQPRGLYLFGGVGRGKSMLMDLFFQAAPVAKKQRVHFHAFMQGVHKDISAWRKMDEATRKSMDHYVRGVGDDPIPPVAEKISSDALLLCFDEFQVSDVADAMLLGRLFEALLERGVVVVATSNRPPDDLYKDGLNRQLFLPFIGMIKTKLDVLEIDAGIDYRLGRLRGQKVFHAPLGHAADEALQQAWERLTDADSIHRVLEIGARKLPLVRAARGVAQVGFDALCREPRGAADYLALAEAFHAVIITDIPKLGANERNEAKRFVTLVDALYEAKVKLVCSADAQAEKLYVAGDGIFEFERTVSRLLEMQSADYWTLPHAPGGPPR